MTSRRVESRVICGSYCDHVGTVIKFTVADLRHESDGLKDPSRARQRQRKKPGK
jgi:hypothetical protein